ncbi:MAG: hypothetical protein LBL63_05015 [Clostridiales Family XIII bacterium]|jgi:hypothetical protein|nr:hypothetical protein [Clostridiales Family XIII bacterium]
MMDTLKSGAIQFLQWITPFGMAPTTIAVLILAALVFCYGYLRRKRGPQKVALGILGFDAVIVLVTMLIMLTGEEKMV